MSDPVRPAPGVLVCPVHGLRPAHETRCKAVVNGRWCARDLVPETHSWVHPVARITETNDGTRHCHRCGRDLEPGAMQTFTPANATCTDWRDHGNRPSESQRCAGCEGVPGYHTRTCPVANAVDPIAEIHVLGMQEAMARAAHAFARHPLSDRFHELLRDAGDMHDAKQADYGSDSDPFANVRAASEWGMPGWVGAMVRVNDKVRRLQAFARKGTLANESAQDSFMDIAVYALIAHVLYSEESAPASDS